MWWHNNVQVHIPSRLPSNIKAFLMPFIRRLTKGKLSKYFTMISVKILQIVHLLLQLAVLDYVFMSQ